MNTQQQDSAIAEDALDKSPVCECEFVMWNCTLTCDNPASWWGISLCCGERGLYCDSCKWRADGNGDYRYRLDMCSVCKARGMKWVKL